MTLYYTIVFIVLVAEMLAFLVLVAPLPAQVHHKFVQLFRSPAMANVMLALKFTFVFILVLFIDSVNRVSRVGQDLGQGNNLPLVDRGDLLARKFYAQRNMYLCGFTLFLSLILNRTYSMVKQLSELRLQTTGSLNKSDSLEVTDLKAKLESKKRDYKALKAQSDGLTREYNRVCDKLNELEGQVASAGRSAPAPAVGEPEAVSTSKVDSENELKHR